MTIVLSSPGTTSDHRTIPESPAHHDADPPEEPARAGDQEAAGAAARDRHLRADPRSDGADAGRCGNRAAVDEPGVRARRADAAGAVPLLPEQVRAAERAGAAADAGAERAHRRLDFAGGARGFGRGAGACAGGADPRDT